LDTTCIIQLFWEQLKPNFGAITKDDLKNNVTLYKKDIWNSILNLDYKLFRETRKKKYLFNYQIQTDGISCSLSFILKNTKGKIYGTRTPKAPKEEYYHIDELSIEQLNTLKSKTIVGCDPGKRSMVYMVDKDRNKLQYTTPQRNKENKSKRNKNILLHEKRKNQIIEKETELSNRNSKTMNYELFKIYIKEKTKLNTLTNEFYQRETWRKMKFYQYSYGQRSIDKFLNNIQKKFGDNIVIGYGDWSRTTQMKYSAPSMGRGLRKLIHKRYDTISINESYTSKKCCECYQDLKHHHDQNGKEIYRLLKCSNCVSKSFKRNDTISINDSITIQKCYQCHTNCTSNKDIKGNEIYGLFKCSECVSLEDKRIVFRTRDMNAACNIQMLTHEWIHHQSRPIAFQRPEQIKKSSPGTTSSRKLKKPRSSLG